tara:strand:- start:177 stop:335 length:159 start_codon:yes stop_codon:yes gene_type:complete
MNEIKKDIESLLDDFNLDEFSSHFSNENDFKYLVKNLTNYVKFKINENNKIK